MVEILKAWVQGLFGGLTIALVSLVLACGSFYLLRLAIPDQAAALVSLVLIWIYSAVINKLIGRID